MKDLHKQFVFLYMWFPFSVQTYKNINCFYLLKIVQQYGRQKNSKLDLVSKQFMHSMQIQSLAVTTLRYEVTGT